MTSNADSSRSVNITQIRKKGNLIEKINFSFHNKHDRNVLLTNRSIVIVLNLFRFVNNLISRILFIISLHNSYDFDAIVFFHQNI